MLISAHMASLGIVRVCYPTGTTALKNRMDLCTTTTSNKLREPT